MHLDDSLFDKRGSDGGEAELEAGASCAQRKERYVARVCEHEVRLDRVLMQSDIAKSFTNAPVPVVGQGQRSTTADYLPIYKGLAMPSDPTFAALHMMIVFQY